MTLPLGFSRGVAVHARGLPVVAGDRDRWPPPPRLAHGRGEAPGTRSSSSRRRDISTAPRRQSPRAESAGFAALQSAVWPVAAVAVARGARAASARRARGGRARDGLGRRPLRAWRRSGRHRRSPRSAALEMSAVRGRVADAAEANGARRAGRGGRRRRGAAPRHRASARRRCCPSRPARAVVCADRRRRCFLDGTARRGAPRGRARSTDGVRSRRSCRTTSSRAWLRGADLEKYLSHEPDDVASRACCATSADFDCAPSMPAAHAASARHQRRRHAARHDVLTTSHARVPQRSRDAICHTPRAFGARDGIRQQQDCKRDRRVEPDDVTSPKRAALLVNIWLNHIPAPRRSSTSFAASSRSERDRVRAERSLLRSAMTPKRAASVQHGEPRRRPVGGSPDAAAVNAVRSEPLRAPACVCARPRGCECRSHDSFAPTKRAKFTLSATTNHKTQLRGLSPSRLRLSPHPAIVVVVILLDVLEALEKLR